MYQTTAAYAASHNLTVDQVRRADALGTIPGAQRIGSNRSRWAIPTHETPPARGSSPDGRGFADTSVTASGTGDTDVMSSGPTVLDMARRIHTRVESIHTRPARALTDVTFTVAALALAHSVNRDGMCARCGWTYPCPDRVELIAALTHADDLTATGVAS